MDYGKRCNSRCVQQRKTAKAYHLETQEDIRSPRVWGSRRGGRQSSFQLLSQKREFFADYKPYEIGVQVIPDRLERVTVRKKEYRAAAG